MLSGVLCLTLWDPIDCSLPGASVHGILQARILEWVAIPFSRGSSQPKDQTQVSCIAGGFFTNWATREYKAEKWVFKENHHINCTKEERKIFHCRRPPGNCVSWEYQSFASSSLFFSFDFLFSHEIYVQTQQYEYEYGRSGGYQPLLSILLYCFLEEKRILQTLVFLSVYS